MLQAPKNYTLADVKRDFGVEFDTSGKLSLFGGMQPLLALLKRADIKKRLSAVVGKDKATVLLQVAIGIIAGAADMEEVERVGKDGAVAPYLKKPLSATRIPRILRTLSRSELEKLHEFVISLSLLDLATHVPRGGFLDVDVDSTAVEKFGKQEGVKHGYIEKDKIEPCYQYLFFRLHQTNSFLYGTIRDGSAHSQNGFIDHLRRFLPIFRDGHFRVRLRADSGFFSEEAIEVATENKAFIYVKTPISPQRRELAASAKLDWIPAKDGKSEYAIYQTVTENDAIWREVFKRVPLNDGSLFLDYKFACVVTNDMETDPEACFKIYNSRANIENNIRELKNDYKLGKIITSRFDVNDAITQATMMAYILIQHFKRLVLDKSDQKIQLSTLRWRVLHLPTMLLAGGRRRWYRVSSLFETRSFFLRLYKRIASAVSFLVRPPPKLIY